jgi:hypothetical protein
MKTFKNCIFFIITAVCLGFGTAGCKDIADTSSENTATTPELIIKSQQVYNAAGSLTDNFVYSYDQEGYLLNVTDYDDTNTLTDTSIYVFNDGKRQSVSRYSATGVLTNYTEYTYDTTGVLSKRTEYRITSGVASTTIRQYSLYYFSESEKTTVVNYSSAQAEISSQTFTYDSSGLRTKSMYSDGSYWIWTYPDTTTRCAIHYSSTGVLEETRIINLTEGTSKEDLFEYYEF